MVYATDEPDIKALSDSYSRCINDLGEDYLEQCRRSHDARRNIWPGKTTDLRKSGENAWPWKGASDQETHVVSNLIDTHVALAMRALNQSHTKALAVKMESLPRASAMSAFFRWMRANYIRGFQCEHELACNYGHEKGLMISYVGWERKERTYKEEMSIEKIAEAVPEIAELIADGGYDDELAAMLQQQWPKLKASKAKKAIRQLRTKGTAELVVSRSSLMDSRPFVRACAPDGEVFFPSYVTDPQRSPYIFWRQAYTAQEIESMVTTEKWDREWADHLLTKCAGLGVDDISIENTTGLSGGFSINGGRLSGNDELYIVVHAYQRLIDEDDGSEGIYCTVFSPWITGETADVPQPYAKRELMNGYDDYPFAVTRMSSDTARMYDLLTMPERLRGAQHGIKTERDSRADRASFATCPPMTGPNGKPPPAWGPGAYIGERRKGEYGFAEVPRFDPGSIEIEQTLMKTADRIAGLDPENPLTPVRQQFFVNKTLEHAVAVLRLAYKCFQRFGPDEIFFNVTGVPDPITISNIQDDEFDVTMTFDTLNNDPETMKGKAEFFSMLIQADKTGRLDAGKHTEFMAYSVDPAYAAYVIQPAEENAAKLQKAVTDDFAKLYSGVAVGPQPNGAQITLQMLQMWAQEPDVTARLQGDEAFAARVENYAKQAQFQITQAQNAETGKIGTAPTTFQNSNLGAP
jgi:hypothetical protein